MATLKELEVTLFWKGDNFKNKPEDFQIIIDAEVEGIKGLPLLDVAGSVRGLTIDIGLLSKGSFPIVGIDSVSVSIEGDMGGMEVKAGLVLGVLKLDKDYTPIESSDQTTEVRYRTLYAGIMGGVKNPWLGRALHADGSL